MGFFSAFARGAAGPGLINLSQTMRQREIEAARAAENEKEREFREAERRKDRDAQAAALKERLAGGGRSRSGGGGGGGDEDYGDIVVGGLMQQEGMSQAQARAALEASQRGENIFTKASGRRVPAGDEMGAEAMDEMVPDTEKWMAINRKIGEMLTRSRSIAKSNDAQLADGERTRWGTAAGQAAESFPQVAPALNRGQQVAKGEYDPEGDAAKRKADEALAAQRNANASNPGRGGRDPANTVQSVKTGPGGRAIAVMRDGTTRDLGFQLADFDSKIAKVISDMEKADYKFAKLPEDEKRAIAMDRLGQGAVPAKPAAPPANRPSLDSFLR